MKFSTTYQPKNKGRKPQKLRKYIKDNNLAIDDIRLMMKKVLATDSEDLEILVKDKQTPMMIRLFIRAYLDDFKKGKLDNFDRMVDRIFGKSTEHLEHSGGLEVSNISPEERKKRIDELMDRRNNENNTNKMHGSESVTD